jgi:hypothetical protein
MNMILFCGFLWSMFSTKVAYSMGRARNDRVLLAIAGLHFVCGLLCLWLSLRLTK